MDIVEEKQYHEELMEWCNNIYFHWQRMKPRFLKLFDLKSLEEWEESCLGLKEKLQTDRIADIDEYQTAQKLFEQWEILYRESINDQKEIKSDVREMSELSPDSNMEIELSNQESDKAEDEPINMTIKMEIPLQEFRKILLDYKKEVVNWESTIIPKI
ncbi:hypothetical protein [Fredinandcohnia onubensis]|uniref:hypothetical protein n=1 Tax=Fredinandcohnia onubensis TaxID=1571209 RepID=UPI000C0BDBD2|nr:hypothetical protein [Fredinandcohnia onubensis]